MTLNSASSRSSDIRRALKELFGFDNFLANQAAIVEAILLRRDAFAVMPTGGGKSLCYQLPAHLMDGVCMVISPLISLMKDQVDAAVATGLRAAYLNSSLSAALKRHVEVRLTSGELDLIYVSPERYAMPEFIACLKRIKLAFVAIDEAHCISEWGHDFRPDYLNLSGIVSAFPEIPVAAFTATATRRVQQDIVTKLGLRDPHVVRASFNRPNLCYKVIPKHKPSEQILRFVRAHSGTAGIVYRTTRKSVEQTADHLKRHGIRALPYHAGLDDTVRARNQEAFNRDEVEVIVATIAFGMGIDKSNVRYVLHGDLPKNIEGYYQETGRSGRDGEPAQCLLLFGYGDIPKIRYFIDTIGDDVERERALRCLNHMVRYATVFACRRKQLLNYFGETYERLPDPGCCDICAGEVESVDATRDAQIVLSAMARTGNRFGVNHIVALITGESSNRLRQLGHDRIKTFGVGRDRDKYHWRGVIDHLLAQGLIRQTTGDYPVLQPEPEAQQVLFKGRQVTVLKTQRLAARSSRLPSPSAAGPYDETLFEQLRELRRKLAAAQGVPPYVIFSDRTLHEMARSRPVSATEMLGITGVGQHRLTHYGGPFMDLIRNHQDKSRVVISRCAVATDRGVF